ncbi:PREDICTED: uncharacterized protein LOC105571805 isoform X2 [Cercocebus atys]|uniref:uncharacterized protein LOC105571805 isoform X2 n=1 Tax=Cercocebus atys TaxID=9531 RepID=UPI0005F43052|nr:PREDICTED: uncharacterized protein LOC105571805 isoform X2 [Cercocebus atys]
MRRNSKAQPVLHLKTVQCSANQIFRNFTGIIVQINCKHSIQMDIHKNSSDSVLLLSYKDDKSTSKAAASRSSHGSRVVPRMQKRMGYLPGTYQATLEEDQSISSCPQFHSTKLWKMH